uniref:ENTH domain-containing protein n=1 Tax=Meloidogyne hapla TaxID=6305 RepID=A0A1I8B4S1_MELHA
MAEESFVKSQLAAFCKALNKVEAPLKQKHVRALVVGTHKLRSSRIFWHSVSRIQLEKNPVLTWKFCQLLHKLIHDGHRKTTEESVGHVARLNQLGNFWQHLRSSGYGQANTCYCKLLVSRLQFHKKYPSIPGNLNLNQRQLDTLCSDINETYELAIDMLDQMDELLNLKATIMSIMDSMRWSSLVPQGQCLLAPLIMVILDTSKFYDFLVKAHFKLHKSLPADTLVGHRERFYDVFRRTKKFYEETANLQYFKYLVQIPTLPAIAPNFQQASELEDYRAPQAYLHAGTTSENGDQTPPDSQSFCDEQISSIIDFSLPQMDNVSMMGDSIASSTIAPSTSNNAPPIFDPKDEIIARLRLDIDAERDIKEKLFQECKNRIEQYEARLVQMNQEIELHKEATEEKTKELEELRVLSTTLGQERQQTTEESKRKVDETEHKFAKLKGAYQQIREDHIKALTEIRDLRAKIDSNVQATDTKDEELTQLKAKMEQDGLEREFFESQAKTLQESIQIKGQKLNETQTKIEQLESQLEEINDILAKEKNTSAEKQKQMEEINLKIGNDFLDCITSFALNLMEQTHEDSQNATSISYPPHLATSKLKSFIEQKDVINSMLTSESKNEFYKSILLVAQIMSDILLVCPSAAYTASIQHFEEVNEQCRQVQLLSSTFFKEKSEKSLEDIWKELENLETLMIGLPKESNDIDVNTVGKQLEEEMNCMTEAIAAAVEHINELQKKSRETNIGIKLEVNDKILNSCNELMTAVRELVIKSKEVQEEIVANGRGMASPVEFYKRNHLWTEGLISAGRAVGVTATELV